MSPSGAPKDLALLVADKNIEGAVRGLLTRPRSLGLREISCDVYVHPERDPGCLVRGHDFMKQFAHRYRHGLVLFDREGSGDDEADRPLLERRVEERLAASGWGDRAAAVVIDPELEIWVWNESSHVERILGWEGRLPSLRTWLREKGWLENDARKPVSPKKAVEEALRLAGKPRSSSIYQELARKVSTKRCTDPAFLKLCQTLARWFPRSSS
jgi:hypothetical protein